MANALARRHFCIDGPRGITKIIYAKQAMGPELISQCACCSALTMHLKIICMQLALLARQRCMPL
jgi:hypothetical protein